MFSRFVIVACLCLGFSSAWLFSGPDCDEQNSCKTCAQTESWSGKRCRWCPRTSTCHAHGSVVNKCSRAENVVNSKDCNKIVQKKYDKNLAYKLVQLCALAYSPDVAKYKTKAESDEVKTFHLVKQVINSCSGEAMCSGFVAVSHSEKAIAIAFRGTEHSQQLITQMKRVLLEQKQSFEAGGKVQGYFKDAFEVVWKDLKSYVYEQIKKYPNYEVWVTGHSLGGALASLASTTIAFERKKRHQKKTPKDNLVLYTFGQPRVGNYDYAFAHDNLVPQSFRVTHYRDVVVHLPTCTVFLPGTPCISLGGGPYHHGKEVFYGTEIMAKDSSYKTCNGNPKNEDFGCSDNPLVWGRCFTGEAARCVEDHKQYFGLNVGIWWKSIQV
ncbi:lipase ZK262.3-like [Dendronephthya gigantea]|uniref:lipase ZK262.3-like n=1 Tax=Dendronephthya gigantea TaxID=151771 RepID=UPI00106B1486|nr:lipase ZK262.3-like [Dendronephthya gigantea]